MNKVLVIMDFKTLKTSQYDKVMEDLNEKNILHNSGLISHTACATPTGGLRVVDIWESEKQFKKFGETLIPTLNKHGVKPAEPSILHVHNLVMEQVYST